jgi:hypothetical protein
VGEQSEKAATSEVLVDEDNGGKSRGPASPAGAAGRLLVQEGHGDEALLLARLDSSGRLIGGRGRGAEQRGERPNGGRGKAKWVTASLVMPGAVLGGGHWEQGWRTGPGHSPGRSNGNGPMTCGPSPLNNFSNFQTVFPYSKNIHTLHEARF